MKKVFLILIFLALPTFFVHAQTATSTAPVASTLNAGFLSDVWYSYTTPTEGDSIKIFGGIYNTSSVNISGSALYYIDGVEIGRTPFVSTPNTLTQVSIGWLATPGSHKVRIKAQTTEPLAQAESGEGTISVAKLPVKANLQKDTQDIIKKTTDIIDPVAEKFADNLNTLGDSLGDSAQKKVVSAVGASNNSSGVAAATASVSPIIQAVFDGAAFLVRHWAWSLLGLVIIYFIWKKSRKENSWW